MAKAYFLFFIGTAPGQPSQMERAGYVFNRGDWTEVPKDVHDLLKSEPGFASGKNPPKGTSAAEKDEE